MRILVVVLLVLAAAAAAGLSVSSSRWQLASATMRDRVSARGGPMRFDPAELDSLPAPARRYLAQVLTPGMVLPRAVDLTQRGEFLVRAAPEQWGPFRARQRVAARPPAFVWDARIAMAPGLTAFVRDAFVEGAGSMRGALLACVPVMDAHGDPVLDEGALMRWLAEAPWCPTLLLPSQGAEWTGVDDRSARVAVRTGAVRAWVEVRFGADGLVESVWNPARGRAVGGAQVPTPWEGRFARYAAFEGMRIPTEGEVAWLLPEGRQVYWRGQVESLRVPPPPGSP